MDISVENNAGQVKLIVAGRWDTAASAQTASDIERKLALCSEIDNLVCDASGLSYISSSGLRIFLSLAKRYGNFSVVNVQPDVYQVFEMTGFTKIMTVSKGFRQLSVDGCEIIGRGGVGVVYRIDDDTIIKVFRKGTTIDEVQTEITMAKEAFVLGMPTAISFDIVKVDSQFGLVYELLKADTLSASLMKDPARIDELARLYGGLFRQLHSIEVPRGSSIPSVMDREEQAVRYISKYFDSESVDLLLQVVHSIPEGNRLLHCDLQTKNAMMQNNELMLIDMGEVGYGHPIVDLGHACSAMVNLVGDYEAIIGMPRQLGKDLWTKAMDYYFEGLSAEEKSHRLEQIDVVACVRNFSWLSLSDSFPEEVIRMCQEQFAERVTKRKEYILRICKTLNDWKL